MTSEIISGTLICLGGLGFVLQFANAILHEDNRKWYRRINRIGWWVIGTCAATIIFGILSIVVTKIEREAADDVSNAKLQKLQRSLDIANTSLKDAKTDLAEIKKLVKDTYNADIVKSKEGNVTFVTNNYEQIPKKTKTCLIKFMTANRPDKTVVKLCNGDYMLFNYRPHNNGKSITIPYMKGKDYIGTFAVFGNSLIEVEFIKETGTFNLGYGFDFGIASNGEPGYDSVNFSFLAELPVREKQ